MGITDKDFNYRPFFEQTMGMQILGASFQHNSLTYKMYSPQFKKTVVVETKPDTSISITVGKYTRILPKEVDLEKALGQTPTQMVRCRLIQEIILKMVEDQKDAVKRDVTKSFDRLSRRGH